jgi:hypothetical protein
MKKFLKWTAILVGGVFALLVVIGLLLPEEYVERAREGRLQREAEEARAASSAPPPSAASPVPAAPAPEPSLTPAQRNAVRSARGYLNISGFSREGLINQLSSEYGDKYNVGDATVAVDSLNVDWNTQAARSAAAYLKISGFSCQGLIGQLSSDAGDKYTASEATYGATQTGIC